MKTRLGLVLTIGLPLVFLPLATAAPPPQSPGAIECTRVFAGEEISDAGWYIQDPLNRGGTYSQLAVFGTFIVIGCSYQMAMCTQYAAGETLIETGNYVEGSQTFQKYYTDLGNLAMYEIECLVGSIPLA